MALIGTLTSGVSALRTFSKGLEVIGSNIANVNTTAYKGASTSFKDTFSNTLRAATGAAGDSAVQIGTGVQIGGITTNFTQGSLSTTGKGTDLAVSGNGYFAVQNGAGVNYATRDGSFHFDTTGNLVNGEGMSVLDTAGAAISIPNYDTVASFSIGTDGTVNVFYDDGTTLATPQVVGLLKIADETKLMKQGGNLYDFGATGTVVGDIAGAGTNGLGDIRSHTLEMSNVDLTDQFAELITTQRSFQAGSRLITVSDSVLEDIVNLKRS
jgi:flagellar hook protein FlgE